MKWQVYVDGASSGNPGNSGAGILVLDEHGNEVDREGIFLGVMTNNMAEYEALVRALRKAKEFCVDDLVVYTDSELVAKQVKGQYKVKNGRLLAYVQEALVMIRTFRSFQIEHIPRERNGLADKLAKNAAEKKG